MAISDLEWPIEMRMEWISKYFHASRRIPSEVEMLFLLPETGSDSEEGGAGKLRTAFYYGITKWRVPKFLGYVLITISWLFERTHSNTTSRRTTQ